jgi:hypothetical protein
LISCPPELEQCRPVLFIALCDLEILSQSLSHLLEIHPSDLDRPLLQILTLAAAKYHSLIKEQWPPKPHSSNMKLFTAP